MTVTIIITETVKGCVHRLFADSEIVCTSLITFRFFKLNFKLCRTYFEDFNDGGGYWRGNSGGGIGPWRQGGGGGGGGGGDRGGSGGHCVHMRGLPFKASPADIAFVCIFRLIFMPF